MGQKANPISLQVGTKTGWTSEFSEKTTRDTGVIHHNTKELSFFIAQFFAKQGFQTQEFSVKYQENSLRIFVSLFSPIIEKKLKIKEKKLSIRNKRGEKHTFISGNKKNAQNCIKLLIKIISKFFYENTKIIVFVDYANKQFNIKGKKRKELKKNLVGLRRYKKQDFFQEGVQATLAVSKTLNSSTVFVKFLLKYLQTSKKINVLVKFLQKIFQFLIESPNYPITGIRLKIKGRINGANRARTRILVVGDVASHSVKTNLKYLSAHTQNRKGSLGVKMWFVHKN